MPTALLIGAHAARRLRGHPAGYLAIAVAAFASWAGLPGPGEAALIAGGAFAARGRLDIVQVELFAFGGAAAGGMVGWALGWRFGRFADRPGPLFRLRRRGLRAGERFYERFGPLAIFLTPSWVAGIHRVTPVRFTVYNAASAAVWAAIYGLTTYFAGPHVADFFRDIGGWASLALVLAAAGFGGFAFLRRRRRRMAARSSPGG
jgi:membrane protein DedA with SNARE-associated domain